MSGETEVTKVPEVPKCDHKETKSVNANEVPRLIGVKDDVFECVSCGQIVLKPKESKKGK